VPSLRVRNYDLGARVSIQGVRLRGVKHCRLAKYRCLMYVWGEILRCDWLQKKNP